MTTEEPKREQMTQSKDTGRAKKRTNDPIKRYQIILKCDIQGIEAPPATFHQLQNTMERE